MKRFTFALISVLSAVPAVAVVNVCPFTVTTRASECPFIGDCTRKGSTLNFLELDSSLLDIVGLCTAISGPAAYTWPIPAVGFFSSDLQGNISIVAAALGPVGPAGPSGNTVLNGSAVPSFLIGVTGDFYLDTVAIRLYGPKISGAWGSGISIKGLDGSNGTPGVNGSTWYSGSTIPSSGTGVDNDYHFRTSTGDVSKKISGTWSIIANITGPSGSNGTAATIAVGTVTTGNPGTSASVTNVGSSSAATFNITIPRGDVGASGADGAIGPAGPSPTGSGNKVLATPADGSSAPAILRSLVIADAPTWNQNTTGNASTSSDGLTSASGTLPLTMTLTAKALTASLAVTPANPGGAIALQTSTPGAAQTGNVNLSGAGIFGGALTGSNLSGTNTGDQTITGTGDVTGSGTGSIAFTIANGAVTLAKMANVTTSTFFGRSTAGTGAPEVLSVATAKTLLSLTGTNSGDQAVPITTTLTASNYFSAYDASTGAFTKARPACADLSNAAASCSTDTTNASNLASGTVPLARLSVFVASGASHAAGLVPDPGASAGTTRFLREDSTFAAPPGASPAGSGTELQYRSGSSLGALTGSSVSGIMLTLPGALNIGGTTSDYCKLDPIGFSLLRVKTADGSGYCILDGQSFRAITPGGNMGVKMGGNTGVELSQNVSVTFSNQTDADQGSKVAGVYIDHTWITCGAVGSCGSAQKGIGRCAADGSWCWCNGSTWTPTPLTGSCI